MIAYQIDHWKRYHLLEEERPHKTLCRLFVPKQYSRIERVLIVSEYKTKLCAHCLRKRMKGEKFVLIASALIAIEDLVIDPCVIFLRLKKKIRRR